MSRELATERPDLLITIHAVNDINDSPSVELLSDHGALAVLQDDEATQVWSSWGAGWRDIIILDPLNEAVYTYNSAVITLDDPDVYAAVKNAFIAVAEGRPPPPGVVRRLSPE